MEPKVINGGLAVDDRGKITFANDFDFKKVKRFYLVENHPDYAIRGWHGHRKEAKYALVSKGLAIFVLSKIDAETDPLKFFLSSDKPEILYIPAGYYHAYYTRIEGTQIMFFSTATLEESKKDDLRKKIEATELAFFNTELR